MNNISETHPTLKYFSKIVGHTEKWYKETDVQKHTIDKAVLKEMIFDENLFPVYDKYYRNYLCKKLGLEEKNE